MWWELGTPWYPTPVLFDGNWYNIACGSCQGDCSCTRIEQIVLPGPITSITEVKIDGDVLSSNDYRLDDWRKITRLDGLWPICNDLNKPDTEEGTWSVSLVYGQPVPTMGRMAVGELAYQLILACMGDDCCVLPYRIQQLARQGVSIDFPDVSQLMDVNRLGLQFCDMFLDAGNPYGLRSRSEVYNIDAPSPTIAGSGS
jgi:hypothetical protein